MSSTDTSRRDVKAIVDRYRTIGLVGGLFLGAVVGVGVAGPHFGEWSGIRAVSTIVGGLGVGGLIGYVAGEIAVASLASGSGPGLAGGGGDSDGAGSDGGGDGGGGDS